ncbi:MAG TPA: Holliday junction branch migration protein RuvA [Actinomycetota bacterium]|nr:Holliday junction branch migration protein RuvA [Actinomycetota bacterium]
MIASIHGTLVELLADGAVIDVGGVGYRVHMPASAITELPARGKQVRVQTHLHVREDAMTLYGFATSDQRDLFVVLLGVNGIGPKGALAVLSVHTPDAFRKAVATEDLEALTMISGIGKKTAARMVLELREKLALPELEVVPGGENAARAATVEVKGALLSLGYSVQEARDALDRVPQNGHDYSTEELLKLALKELSRL